MRLLRELVRIYLFILGIGCIIMLIVVGLGFAAAPGYFLLNLAIDHSWWIATAFVLYPAWVWIVVGAFAEAVHLVEDSLP